MNNIIETRPKKGTRSVCIDYMSLQTIPPSKKGGEPDVFGESIALKDLTEMPVMQDLLDTLDAGSKISPDLKIRMEDAVERIFKSNIYEITQIVKENPGIEALYAVAKIQNSQFRLEVAFAKALLAMEEGKAPNEIKKEVEGVLESIKTELVEKNVNDFIRDKIIVEVEGEKYFVSSSKELKELFPELTGEQVGYIATIGNQSLLGSAGYMPIGQSQKDGTYLREAKGSGSVSRSVVIEGGNVKIVSTKAFESYTIEDMDRLDEMDLPKLRTSLVVDISSLKGDEFRFGCTKGVKVRQYIEGVEPDSKVTKSAQEHGAIIEDTEVKSDISKALEASGIQDLIEKGNYRSAEENSKYIEIERRKASRLAKLPEHRQAELIASNNPEILAIMAVQEYEKNSPLFDHLMMRIGTTESISPSDELTGDELKKAKMRISISAYCYKGQDKERQKKHALEQLKAYDGSISEKEIQQILKPLHEDAMQATIDGFQLYIKGRAEAAVEKQRATNQTLRIEPSAANALLVDVYSKINPYREDALEFAAHTLSENSHKLSKEDIIKTLAPVTPESQKKALEENAESIMKTANLAVGSRKNIVGKKVTQESKKEEVLTKLRLTIAPETIVGKERKLARSTSSSRANTQVNRPLRRTVSAPGQSSA